MEWLNMFSGGLDVIPIIIAIYLIFFLPKAIKVCHQGYRIGFFLAIVMCVCMIIAQTGWVYAVTQNIYLLGTAFDNIWLIVNTLAVLIPLVFAIEQTQQGIDDDEI